MRFRVHGLPAPQGSKRHVGGGRMVESSRAVGPWREAVRAEAARYIFGLFEHGRVIWDMPTDEPLEVTLKFILKRPKSHFGTGRNAGTVRPSAPRFPAGRPDVDKLVRAVLDGLVAGGVMADDSQVVSLNAAKVYAANGEAPGAVVDVEAMEPVPVAKALDLLCPDCGTPLEDTIGPFWCPGCEEPVSAWRMFKLYFAAEED